MHDKSAFVYVYLKIQCHRQNLTEGIENSAIFDEIVIYAEVLIDFAVATNAARALLECITDFQMLCSHFRSISLNVGILLCLI